MVQLKTVPQPETAERDPVIGKIEEVCRNVFVSAADILSEPVEVKPLLGKIIEHGTTGQLFGPSGGGKTFIALDMTLAVATGLHWNGNPCSQGVVLYFAGEGHAGLRRRVKAWHQHHGQPDLSCCQITRYAIPFDAKGLAEAVADARTIEQQAGKKVVLIVVDTLARHIQGDENSTQHMSDFIRSADDLREKFPSSTIIIVHHTGNDSDKSTRSRGSSALKAAMDFEIRCDKGLLTYTKVKDGEEPEPTEFKLVPVNISEDDTGAAITSCVVEYGERSNIHKQAVFTSTERIGIETLVRASANLTTESGGLLGALVGDWRKAFYDARLVLDSDLSNNTLKQSFKRTHEALVLKKVVKQDGNTFILFSDDHQVDIKNQKYFDDLKNGGVQGTNTVQSGTCNGVNGGYTGTHPYKGCTDVPLDCNPESNTERDLPF